MISLKDLTVFLPHVGARLGFYEDPPGASFCVEGGNYNGAAYSGAVFSPAVATSGTTRIDTVIADPASGDLVLVEGVENSGIPPALDAYTGAGPIVDVHVVGRANGKVVIERTHLIDRRSVVVGQQAGFQLIEIGVVPMGGGSIPAPNSAIGSFKVVGSQKWTALRTTVGNKTYQATGSYITWVDLEFPRAVSDLHLVVQPYDTVLSAAPNESGDHPNAVGVSWVSLGSVAGKPRFRIVATASEGVSGEIGTRILSMVGLAGGAKLASDLSVKVHVQVWGRTS